MIGLYRRGLNPLRDETGRGKKLTRSYPQDDKVLRVHTFLAWFFYAISIFITWFTPICMWSATLTLVTEVQESKSLYPSCVTKFPNKLDGIWNTVETCWCGEPHTHFILSIQYLRERTLLTQLKKKEEKIHIGLCLHIYRPIFSNLVWW